MRQRDENRKIPPNDLSWLQGGVAARPLPNRTRVVCVEHNGQHEGLIVHDLGFAYGVAWDFVNKPENRVHAKDATHIAYDAVREVVECSRCGANLAADDHVRGHQTSKENDR